LNFNWWKYLFPKTIEPWVVAKEVLSVINESYELNTIDWKIMIDCGLYWKMKFMILFVHING